MHTEPVDTLAPAAGEPADSPTAAAAAPPPPCLPRGALGDWWAQGVRSALFFKPDWALLQTTPAVLPALLLVPFVASVLAQRLYIAGEARLHGAALLSGWLQVLVTLWACWLVSQSQPALSAAPGSMPARRPGAACLFSLLMAQQLGFVVLSVLLFVPVADNTRLLATDSGRWLYWGLWLLLVGWALLAHCRVLWACGQAGRAGKALAVATLCASTLLHQWFSPTTYWYAVPSADATSTDNELMLTQAVMEQQLELLRQQLQSLSPRTAGEINVYALTFAPYASEGVFRRESALVSSVMRQRFGAAGKTLELVNHRDTVTTLPWATPLNLQRAIREVARRMKGDDVLFLHLTSHGGRDGQLAAELWPMSVEPLTPQALKGWLDEAGVRHRVISISACYSGSWIAPLADEHTLVMTAADAAHTSYGCGRGSRLTFFGRAMYDEQLRHTWSFEAAHAAARTVIDAREKEAGKTDGYSNPQIDVGAAIRPVLERLAAQQSARMPAQ